MATQPLATTGDSAVPTGTAGARALSVCPSSVRRYWWAAGGVLLVLAGLLLPAGRLLQADSGVEVQSRASEGWEIELVPRSAGPIANSPQPRRARVSPPEDSSRGESSVHREDSAESVAGGRLTPVEKGWEVVESSPALEDRAVPLNAVRAAPAASVKSRTAQEDRAQPLNAAVSRELRPAQSSAAAIRSVSSSRPAATRRTPTAPVDVPSARLIRPNFAKRESAAPPEVPAVVDAEVAAPADPQPRQMVAANRSATRSQWSAAGDSQRPLAGELPNSVAADERAEPLMASSSRSVASAAVRRRSQQSHKSLEIVGTAPGVESGAADNASQVVAPAPRRLDEGRRAAVHSPDSIPLAGHSLFVDPLPLAPTFTGAAPAYPASAAPQGTHTMIPDPRYGWIRGNSVSPPWVVPRNAIPHAGWYGPSPGVRAISHSVPEPGMLPGHSVMDR